MIYHQSRLSITLFNAAAGFRNSLYVLTGIASWEFIANASFDWERLTGQRRRRWTFWVYFLGRISPVIALCFFISSDLAEPTQCEGFMVSGLLFVMISFVSSSFIILLRTIAIWESNRLILVVGAVIWLANFPITMYEFKYVRGVPQPSVVGCIISNTEHLLTDFVSFLVTEFTLLTLTLVGLLRTHSTNSVGLWRTLYRQGWAWLFLSLLAEVPTVILLSLNIDGILNMVLGAPSMLIMTTGATRMYRSLVRAAGEESDTEVREIRVSRGGITRTSARGVRSVNRLGLKSPDRAIAMEIFTTTETTTVGHGSVIQLAE
ncbi:hypothetical protein OF83DRAFT_1117248 [Amylostereum chailletii]|nr:hypothetical protein OF83DRAFT_1117248 [Amylostereum chailletii]